MRLRKAALISFSQPGEPNSDLQEPSGKRREVACSIWCMRAITPFLSDVEFMEGILELVGFIARSKKLNTTEQAVFSLAWGMSKFDLWKTLSPKG